jgi:hypothetical protein
MLMKVAMLCLALAVVAAVFGLLDLSAGTGTAMRMVVLSLLGLGLALLGLEGARRGR